MPDTPTAHFGDTKPEVGASPDTWGGKLNENFDRYDDRDYRLLTTANYGVNTGDENALAVSLEPEWQSLAAGCRVWVKVTADNDAGVTLNVDSTGVKDVVNLDGSTLTGGQLVAGAIHGFVYDGARYRLMEAPRASAAVTLAGADTAQVLTPAGFAGNKSLAASGYYRLPGGFTIQWGTTGAIPDDSTDNLVSFPVAFASACVAVIPVSRSADTTEDGLSLYGWAVTAMSTTGFALTNDSPAGAYTYIALGY